MIVISDTSCVTNLLAIGEERLLERLFTEVVIPEAVGHELRREHAQLPGFIRVVAKRKPSCWPRNGRGFSADG